MKEFLNLIIHSDLPFLILFVTLAYFFMKQSWSREKEQRKMIYEQLEKVNNDVEMLAEVWKTIIDGELERRRKYDRNN
jgi:hypothetical protein